MLIDTVDRIKKLLFGTIEPKFNFVKEAKSYMAAFPLIAQSLVDQSGKKIQLRQYNGGLGCTDGKTIYITPTPMPKNASDVKSFLLFMSLKMGLIHHEIGHVNHTDFTVKRTKDEFQNHIEGIVEDIRQELLHMAKFPASRKYLDALELAMIELGYTQDLPDDAAPINVFTAWLYYKLRCEYSGQQFFQSYLDSTQVVFEQTFGKAIRPRLELLVAQVPGLKSTQEASDLAEEIRTLVVHELKAQQKQAQQQQKKQQQQQQQQKDQQQGQGQGDDSQPEQGNASDDDSDDSTPSPQPPQGQVQASPDASNAPQQTTADDDTSQDQSGQGAGGQQDQQDAQDPMQQTLQNLKDMLDGKDADQAKGDKDALIKKALEDLAQDLVKHGADVLEEDYEPIKAADSVVTTNSLCTTHQASITDAVSVVSRLSSGMRKQLQANSMDKVSRGIRGNKIDTKALLRVPMGDARIFKRIHRAKKLETAVTIMTDISGSMSGRKIQLANQAIYATACAIERLPGCKISVGTFPLFQVVLPFGMRASKNIDRFMLDSTGCTPMAEGVLMGFRMLQRRKESRKVLFVITDGEPDCRASTINTLLAASRLGIEVYAIGIQTQSVKALFENWAVINKIEDLPKVMLDMLKGQICDVAA